MKKFFQFFFFCFTISTAFGQTEPNDDDELVNLDSIFPLSLIADPDTCLAPLAIDVTVLQFATYAEAQLTVFPANLASTINYKEQGSSDDYLSVQTSESGVAMIYELSKNKTYEIAVQNRCGVLTPVGIVSTNSEFEGTVTVSEQLHSELNRYLKSENPQKLTTFLRSLNSISLFERVSFAQKFFFKGTPLTDRSPLLIPDVVVPPPCFCNTLITTQFAIPANLLFVTNGSGNVETYTNPSSGGNRDAAGNYINDLGRNARSWKWLDNKGPGKYHQGWTEGFKAKYGVDHQRSVSWQDNSGVGSQKSFIRVTLICLDGDEVPADCACEKNIEFAYKYDTNVTAHAHLVSGTNGSKKAWAQAEDMYTVIFEDESKPLASRYEVLDMGATRTATACDYSLNPAFWTNITTLLADGAILFLAYTATQNSQGGQLPSQSQQTALIDAIRAFATTLGSVFTTPYGQSTGCNNDDDKFGFVEKQSIQRKFKPNATVTLTMSSYDKIASGGRRAWHSHGRILSGHFLTAVVKHDAFNGEPEHCCTPKIGMWMVGHCGGSATEDQLKGEAADLLYHSGIVNLLQTPNGISVVNDFGYTVQQSSLEICNQIVVNPTVSGGRSNGEETTLDSEETDLVIFDINGRLLSSLVWSGKFTNQDLVALRSTYSNLPTGMYLIVAKNTTGTTSYKLLINNK
jgi:hypothetical protein